MSTGFNENGSFTVSSSSLSTTSRCTLMAALRYAHRVLGGDKSAALVLGDLGHQILYHHFSGASYEHCMAEFYTLWESLNIESAVQASSPDDRDRCQRENVRIILVQYLQTRTLQQFPYLVPTGCLEWRRVVPLDPAGEFLLEVVLDAIIQDRTSGALYIMDHKFTRKLSEWWINKWKLEAQISAYITAAKKLPELAQFNIAGFFINGIELSLLPGFRSSGSRKCMRHKVAYDECRHLHCNYQLVGTHREPWALQAWYNTAMQQAQKLRWIVQNYSTVDAIPYIAMEGTMNGSCMFCDYAEFCAAGRPLNWIGTVLAYQPGVIEKEEL